MAEDLYEATIEARETNDTKYPPGFFLAFFVYPAADSLAWVLLSATIVSYLLMIFEKA